MRLSGYYLFVKSNSSIGVILQNFLSRGSKHEKNITFAILFKLITGRDPQVKRKENGCKNQIGPQRPQKTGIV